jgi:hypothetical protein
LEFLSEEVNHALDTFFLTLLGENRVVTRLFRPELNGDELVAQEFAQRVESSTDEAVARVSQPQHLAPLLGRMTASSSGDKFKSALRALPKANGSDGCERTGATIVSSSIMPSAKPPLKHMPTAPTPLPPSSWCRFLASARNHEMIGDVLRSAIDVNSRDTHTLLIDDAI